VGYFACTSGSLQGWSHTTDAVEGERWPFPHQERSQATAGWLIMY